MTSGATSSYMLVLTFKLAPPSSKFLILLWMLCRHVSMIARSTVTSRVMGVPTPVLRYLKQGHVMDAEDMAARGEAAGLLAWYLEFCLVDLLAEERSFTLLRSDFGLMMLFELQR